MKAFAILMIVIFTMVLSASASAQHVRTNAKPNPITEYNKPNPITEYGVKQHPRTLRAGVGPVFAN